MVRFGARLFFAGARGLGVGAGGVARAGSKRGGLFERGDARFFVTQSRALFLEFTVSPFAGCIRGNGGVAAAAAGGGRGFALLGCFAAPLVLVRSGNGFGNGRRGRGRRAISLQKQGGKSGLLGGFVHQPVQNNGVAHHRGRGAETGKHARGAGRVFLNQPQHDTRGQANEQGAKVGRVGRRRRRLGNACLVACLVGRHAAAAAAGVAATIGSGRIEEPGLTAERFS